MCPVPEDEVGGTTGSLTRSHDDEFGKSQKATRSGKRWTVLESGVTRSEQVRIFAKNFFKHPRMLGSLIPSSRFLIDEVLGGVDWSSVRVFVEYGPGVGSFTTEILRRMSPQASLIVFETNREFVELLRRKYDDPRLTIVHSSAGDVERILSRMDLKRADCIISGIPFSTMPPEVRKSILDKTRAVINPGGQFIVYQFSAEVLSHLRSRFRVVQQDFELLNILPARIFRCQP